ncbi:DUF418 domain-containing protein [Alteraurantiacibacter aestuarii]|uniref:DUF418 domain-containing protein n=1 Tax=Alteraurantiacibacter aestuarii TaxID=650004 RepID=A0A844ZNE1_9SPHN|nr:DUF418 domain-containing protein [Alteraurantiacibacter aestuarii]MXO88842.1 DUF418 domain-containing protein [Alteraurantiacibacter aestuarii]
MVAQQQDSPVEQVTVAPVQAGARIASLDLIRGIAVLGILLANITGFAHVDIAYYWPPALPGGGDTADRLIWLAQYVLVDGKFRGLFSILFGAGMVLFIERIPDYQTAALLQMRRLFWLILFGLAHFYLLFKGDILFSYGCAGMFALYAVPLKARTQLTIGIIWAMLGALWQGIAYLPAVLTVLGGADANPTAISLYQQFWQGQLADAARSGQLMAGDSYLAILRYRLTQESGDLWSYFSFGFVETIPLMMIGMGLFRSGVFHSGEGKPHWRGPALAALVLGLALNLAAGLFVYSRDFTPFITQMAFFGFSGFANVPLLVGGTCLLAQWAARTRDGAGDSWLVLRLSDAGRMAFSNYIGTSLVMVLIFQGWAGDRFGTMHRAELLVVVTLGWAMMIAFSRVWLARFRRGPLEWLWRCLTYWRIFPNRI